jgi:hypothetical protein
MVFLVSCQKAEINFDILGAQDITFPEGKVLTLNKKTNSGYDYEVGTQNTFKCMTLICTLIKSTYFRQGTDGSEVSIFIGQLAGSSSKTATASINYNNPDKLYKIESCRGEGCHVLIEQGEDQNHPNMIGIDVKKAGLPQVISRNQPPFGEDMSLILTAPILC